MRERERGGRERRREGRRGRERKREAQNELYTMEEGDIAKDCIING